MENRQNQFIPHVQKDFLIKYLKLYKGVWGDTFKSNFSYYSISYIIEGNFKVTKIRNANNDYLKKSFTLGKGSFIISKINEKDEFEQLSDIGEFIIIDIDPIVFKNTADEKDVFRIFNYSDINSIYNIKNFSSNLCLECINSMVYCMKNDKGRYHTLLRVKNLVSQLDLELDILLGESRKVEDNMLVKTVTYIEENYAQNLTLDSVSDALGISKSSINRICKKMKQKSFLEYLTEVRMEKAKILLNNPTNNMKTVALLCGYNSYDSFYHAFVKYYGFPPSTNAAINKNKNKRVNWPFETSIYDFRKEYE